MTYTWEILKFSTRDQTNSDGVLLENSVVSIHWRRTGLDSEGNVASIVGHTVLTAETVPEGDFVPFTSLTESAANSWLEANISAERMSSYNEKIQAKINSSITTERAVPWS